MTFPQIPVSIPSPDISYIDLGPFRLHFYAVFILAGIVLAVLLTGRRIRAGGYQGGEAIDIALWAVPFGIVGARLYHVVTHPGDYFYPGADLLKVLYVWEGGIAIFGAVVFGLVGVWIGARRTKIPFLVFLDALAPGMLIAQAIGRIGNYFNQELYGSPTTLPWGLQIDSTSPAFPAGLPDDTLFHPLFLYELVWNLAGAATILLAERTAHLDRRPHLGTGFSLGLYLLWYGVGRAWFESFRLDPTELLIAGVKINLLTALVSAMAGIFLLVNARRLERRRTHAPSGEPAAEES
ncbi:prolipoprotein diacylglyceryl transferase [Leifsonia sp. H3M29-4]|uniref:prolipoprotein diacylglyceryl transferase n=1 Tax=Salinibacterium metalliresistens TaxID=3031321 RepID=UPI0023D9DD3B|nr:prolipoprotein diacylglyceryl transferase [Salinibacterium metalliresistens]MDF1480392.1 prolipoprotein diacylglyceryl transferase [Salinibacterium metalliresistens]